MSRSLDVSKSLWQEIFWILGFMQLQPNCLYWWKDLLGVVWAVATSEGNSFRNFHFIGSFFAVIASFQSNEISPMFFFFFLMNFLLLRHLLWQRNEFILCLSGISIVSPLVMKSFGQHWTMDSRYQALPELPGLHALTQKPSTEINIYHGFPCQRFFHLLIAGLMEPVEERVCCQKTLFLICQLPQKSHSSKRFCRWTIMLT